VARNPAAQTAVGPKFIGAADAFDSGRSARGHLGFAFGVHHCLGPNLARVEMQVAFATLARRPPGLKPAVPAEEPEFKNTQETCGVVQPPVVW
jgi:cytochrome P450